MIEFRYDTQLLIEGSDLDEDELRDFFDYEIEGDSLVLAVMDDIAKVHFHTNEPWKVLEFCAGKGEIFDIVVEDMDRQSRGLQG